VNYAKCRVFITTWGEGAGILLPPKKPFKLGENCMLFAEFVLPVQVVDVVSGFIF